MPNFYHYKLQNKCLECSFSKLQVVRTLRRLAVCVQQKKFIGNLFLQRENNNSENNTAQRWRTGVDLQNLPFQCTDIIKLFTSD